VVGGPARVLIAMAAPRYAIYFAPEPAGALWRFGSAVLGYDAASGEDVPFPPPLAERTDWRELSDDPRRYGFHGTLKAPFSLVDGVTEDDLVAQVAAFARSEAPFTLAGLRAAALGSFIALVPDGPHETLDAFAGRCVGGFEHLRAPLSEADMQRRLAAPLTARQRVHLQRYGYPHVYEDFRFHMTLSGRISDEAQRAELLATLTRLHRAVSAAPVAFDSVSLFRQPARDQRFHILKRFPLG
jgi:putative phosphonate metabolism protein